MKNWQSSCETVPVQCKTFSIMLEQQKASRNARYHVLITAWTKLCSCICSSTSSLISWCLRFCFCLHAHDAIQRYKFMQSWTPHTQTNIVTQTFGKHKCYKQNAAAREMPPSPASSRAQVHPHSSSSQFSWQPVAFPCQWAWPAQQGSELHQSSSTRSFVLRWQTNP